MVATNKLQQAARKMSPDEKKMATISLLVAKYVAISEEIDSREADLKIRKIDLRNIVEVELPEAMDELGVTQFQTADGLEIEVNNETAGNISEANKEAAHKWLRDKGYGDIIKTQLIIWLGKGEDKLKSIVTTFLDKKKIGYEDKEGVHAQTLRAFIKECRKNGVKLPEDLFGLYDYRVAKIKKLKKDMSKTNEKTTHARASKK